MYLLAGTDRPWARRLDHLICDVPDIDRAYGHLLALGFPSAWPVGRFWPGRRTAGIALGGVNLELVQSDEDPPSEARIRTLAFEPTSLSAVAEGLEREWIALEIVEKWEDDPDLLRLRGFSEEQAQEKQLICRNGYPRGDLPISFFFCEYSPFLRKHLSPNAHPGLPPVVRITLATPDPASDWRTIDRLFGLPTASGIEIAIREEPSEFAEVVEITSDRGPIDLGEWPAQFRFV